MSNQEYDYRQIGATIAKLRKGLGWTQKELGRRVGVTQGGIGHLEGGRTQKTTLLPAIAKALGVQVEVLLGDAEALPDPAGDVLSRSVAAILEAALRAERAGVSDENLMSIRNMLVHLMDAKTALSALNRRIGDLSSAAESDLNRQVNNALQGGLGDTETGLQHHGHSGRKGKAKAD
jgi:transcriptional regulator with XRE-family HTH domain